MHPQKIAVALDRSVRTVYRCVAQVREQGVERLLARQLPGAPLKLSSRQRQTLVRDLLAGAMAHGFSTDLWTAPRVQRLIREKYGVDYHVNYVPTLLKALRFTPQKPECRARERNEDAITHWLECDWPRIKKKRADKTQ